LFTSGGAELGL